MSRKKEPSDNLRVVVYPRGLGDFGFIRTNDCFLYSGPDAQERIAREYRERCEGIAADIKRHADNVSHIEIECDDNYACEHCGRPWTEDSTEYNGGCCDKDQDAEDARQQAAA